MSKFENVLVNEDSENGFVKKSKVYLKPRNDFPINVTKEFRIVDAHPARNLFRAKKPYWISFDGETGRTAASNYKDTYECKECKYLKGFKDESGVEHKCQYRCILVFEHDDPEKEYELSVSYGVQKAFSKYVRTLLDDGLDVPNVMTKITRVEPEKGIGYAYNFERGAVLTIEKTESEAAALDALVNRVKESGEPMDSDFAIDLLMKYKSLDGISRERAQQLVDTVCKNGYIEG